MNEKKDERPEIPQPKNSSKKNEFDRAQFFEDFWNLLEGAKSGAPANNGITIKLVEGPFEATIMYQPPVIRYSRGGGSGGRDKSQGKQATEEDVKAILAEYPNELSYMSDRYNWYIRTKSYPFDDWQKVMDKVNGFKNGDWRQVEAAGGKAWVIPKGE